MRFRCERDTLAEALGTVARAASASRAGTSPLTGAIRLVLDGDRLELTATDRELTIQVGVVVDGEVDGTRLVPARLVNDIVRALDPGAVLVEVGDDEARISGGRSQFSVHVIVAEFPRTPEPAGGGFTLPAALLAEGLDQVVPAASRDENRQTLNGVLLTAEDNGLRLVATDTYRLAVRDLADAATATDTPPKVLLPSRALRELARVLTVADSVTCYLGERTAVFDAGPVRLATQLVEGDFPNYRPLLPQTHRHRLVVNRELLREAIKRVRLLAQESAPNIRLVLHADGIELRALNQDKGEASEELDARYDGEDMTVAFNPDFLREGIEAAHGDEVVIELLDPQKPAVVRATDRDDFLYLLMPVRVP